jgi:hypothetical protein
VNDPTDRRTATYVLAGLPLLGMVLVAGYVVIEAVRPGTLAAAPLTTVSEAIAAGHPARALELLAGGADINRAARVRAGLVVPGRAEYEVTPLEAAVLVQRLEAVRLLLRSGADPARSPMAVCLARYRLPDALPLLGRGDMPGEMPAQPEPAVRACGGRVWP